MVDTRKVTAAAIGALMLAASGSAAATFQGEFWDVTASPGAGDPASDKIDTLGDVLSIVEGSDARAPDATFKSTGIDYPQGPQGPGATSDTLADWLGTDSASLSGSSGVSMLGSIFRFTGSIFLDAGTNNLSVGSDDGYRLSIGGSVVNSVDATRPFSTDSFTYTNSGAAGATPFELIFYEDNQVAVGVEFKKDGQIAAPVPVPAAGIMLMTALGGLGGAAGLRRRRKTA